MNVLPQELITLIVTNLARDEASLKACSVVASAWVAPCREILFRSVTLGPRHFGEDRQGTLEVFDAIPTLKAIIVTLTISAGKSRGRDGYPPRLAIDPEHLVALLRKMTRLHTIVLERCAVEPKEDMASSLLPHCWDYDRLRLLRIAPSHQAAHLVDIFRTMVFFRNVPVDRLELRRDYDARGYDASSHGKYVPSHFYEMLRGWRVGTFYPYDAIWKPSTPSEREIKTLVSGLLSAGVTDTIQLNNWGVQFLKSFWPVPERENVKHFKLEVLARPSPHAAVQPEDWSLYARLASVESVTFVFTTQTLLERFSKVLTDHALRCLPRSTRTIGFEVQIDAGYSASPHVSLGWWTNKMEWEDLSRALERFVNLESVRFGVTVLGEVGWREAAALNDDMEAVVRSRLSDVVTAEKLHFVRTPLQGQ
ncbi:hypothetical protein PsYK624_033390 [Phanerochaete sordida]|uniref:F-box domain-containing protein n=1 Tax=Phanerochaete sordida TaxID=48140 RepID=A0A9P3G2X5_9APHY|nr:hypothetical protein PsYK624_033390 [Phanerochaete sordida]